MSSRLASSAMAALSLRTPKSWGSSGQNHDCPRTIGDPLCNAGPCTRADAPARSARSDGASVRPLPLGLRRGARGWSSELDADLTVSRQGRLRAAAPPGKKEHVGVGSNNPLAEREKTRDPGLQIDVACAQRWRAGTRLGQGEVADAELGPNR